ncbi:MAG TPA: hypothetical protein VEL76_02135 [Gemmataceae bacterium]|nr:hypothetical protein [Gemmataceae bacterium]
MTTDKNDGLGHGFWAGILGLVGLFTVVLVLLGLHVARQLAERNERVAPGFHFFQFEERVKVQEGAQW